MQLRLSPKVGPYSVAVGLVVLASLLRLVFGPLWREDVPALLFYPDVVLSAWYGGLGPGLVTTILSGLAISYYWLPPQYSFVVSDLNDLLGLAIFFTIGLLISVLNERQVRHATAALATLRKSEQRYRLLFQLNPGRRRDGRPLAILLSVRQDEDGLLEGIAMDIPDRRPTWRSG